MAEWFQSRTLQTAPAKEPITLADAKEHLGVYHDAHDTRIARNLTTARQYVEIASERRFITQTWDFKRYGFWGSAIVPIPYPPLQSLTITYLDSDGVSQTVDSSNYTVDTDSTPGRLYLSETGTWPTTQGVENDVTVRAVVGYGDDPDDVDARVRDCILMLLYAMYEQDSPVVTGTIVTRVPTFDWLLQSIRVPEAE